MLVVLGKPDLEASLARYARLVHEKIDELIPEQENVIGKSQLIQAMRYSILSSGKRLRPFLTIECAKLFSVSEDKAVLAACAVEMIHTYSIVHDDLPAIDNDSERRGQPSCHVKFDEATAILAGNALFALAFEVLSGDELDASPQTKCDMINLIARTCGGFEGMIAGQMMDIVSRDKKYTYEEVVRMQRLKTAELFAACCEMGAVLGRSSKKSREFLRRFALDLGCIFQITDDILDETEDDRKDNDNKSTLIDFIGVKKAKAHAETLASQAVSYLEIFDSAAENLRALVKMILERV